MKKLALTLTLALLILAACQKAEEKTVNEESNNEISITEDVPEQAPKKEDEEGKPLREGEAETLPTKQEALAIYGAAVIDADYHDYSYIPIIGGEISHNFKRDGEYREPFNDRLKPVIDENDMLVYVDEKGKVKLETGLSEMWSSVNPMFPGEPTCDFSDGIAFLGDGRYMDTEGNMIYIKNGCGMYKCGLVMVYELDENGDFLYGYADITGEIKIPCKYKRARDFSENGLALVFDLDRYYNHEIFNEYGPESNPYRGYINTEGEEVIPLEYYERSRAGARHMFPLAEINEDGIVRLYKEGYLYYFNSKGETVGKKPEMYMVHYQENGRKKTMPINLGMYYDSLKENK